MALLLGYVLHYSFAIAASCIGGLVFGACYNNNFVMNEQQLFFAVLAAVLYGIDRTFRYVLSNE